MIVTNFKTFYNLWIYRTAERAKLSFFCAINLLVLKRDANISNIRISFEYKATERIQNLSGLKMQMTRPNVSYKSPNSNNLKVIKRFILWSNNYLCIKKYFIFYIIKSFFIKLSVYKTIKILHPNVGQITVCTGKKYKLQKKLDHPPKRFILPYWD